MKNITLSADEALIERARKIAHNQHTSLNQLFREWLEGLDDRRQQGAEHVRFVREAGSEYRVGGPYGRDELNER
jgi:hypothetical protein